MAVTKKQDSTAKEGLLRDEVHILLDTMSDSQVEELIPYLVWISKTPCSS